MVVYKHIEFYKRGDDDTPLFILEWDGKPYRIASFVFYCQMSIGSTDSFYGSYLSNGIYRIRFEEEITILYSKYDPETPIVICDDVSQMDNLMEMFYLLSFVGDN